MLINREETVIVNQDAPRAGLKRIFFVDLPQQVDGLSRNRNYAVTYSDGLHASIVVNILSERVLKPQMFWATCQLGRSQFIEQLKKIKHPLLRRGVFNNH